MSKRRVYAFVLMILGVIGLSGCDVPCDPGSLVQPDLISPNWREVMDGSAAVLEWSYPDTCDPEEFEIILSKDRDYAVIEHTQLVPGDSTTWTPPTLDTAEEFWWRVRAKVGSSYGGYSGERRSFFTLPYCTAGDLYRANLVSPAYGGIFTRGYDSLEWEWPISACIPESYRVELSTESDFSDTSLNGGTGSPGTRWGPGSPLDPATQYFWRITPFADGTWGPTSIAYSFFTDPICSGASLVAPNAVTPLNGDTLATANPDFEWTYPHTGCSPEGTHFQIATTPDFSTLYIYADNPNQASRRMAFGVPLNDCTTYYWRVAMVSEGVQGPYSFHQAFSVDLTDSCTCDPAFLPVPELVYPEPLSVGILDIVPVNTVLVWENSGPCIPDGYEIKLDDDYLFRDNSLFADVVGGDTINYSPPTLQLATQYWWHVFSTYQGSLSSTSNYASFFTEPECTSQSQLTAPMIIYPKNGGFVDTLTPTLNYIPGTSGCIPDHYFIDLQTDQNFQGVTLLGAIGFPTTVVGPSIPLSDCTMYYLKVAAVQDGNTGPYSNVHRFYVNEQGTCLPPGIPGTAKGNFFCKAGTYDVFEDLWTVEIGHRVLAIGRNPQTTYLLYTILNQETKEPFEHEIRCWGYIGKVVSGWPETPDGVTYSFEDLPVVNPPDPLVEDTCQFDMGPEACKNAGGSYDMVKRSGQYECVCP